MAVSISATEVRSPATRFAHTALIVLTITFAFWRISENSADPDLWGHVLYGERHLLSGQLERSEPFSWTAAGAPWINHEIGAELMMGIAHLAGGARGLWILMVLVGASTLTLAGVEARSRVSRGNRWMVWAGIVLASREVALGFAMRPQIFSAVFWMVFLMLLRHLVAGRRWPVVGIPGLCAIWINIHGGVLLAIVASVALALVSAVLAVCARSGRAEWLVERWPGVEKALVGRLFGTAFLAAVALLLNPYGWRLPAWLVGSVMYVRPEITEWNPTAFGSVHAIFWVMALGWCVAVLAPKARLPAWEMMVGSLVLLGALRHERHVPIFALTMIAFLPGCVGRWLDASKAKPKHFSRHAAWTVCGVFSLASAFFILRAIPERGGPESAAWRMYVPGDEYPVDAIRYARGAGLRGNAIVYFDWAQQALWEFPESKISFDGRLDTCFPRDLIAEHWDFFHRGVLPERAFRLDSADWMLLPRFGAAAAALEATANWRRVYGDRLAAVFVNLDRATMPPPPDTGGWADVGLGERFPDAISSRAAEMKK